LGERTIRWHLAAMMSGIVLVILGGGVAISAYTGFVLIEFIYIATGTAVLIVGAGSTGIGAWKWRKFRSETH